MVDAKQEGAQRQAGILLVAALLRWQIDATLSCGMEDLRNVDEKTYQNTYELLKGVLDSPTDQDTVELILAALTSNSSDSILQMLDTLYMSLRRAFGGSKNDRLLECK